MGAIKASKRATAEREREREESVFAIVVYLISNYRKFPYNISGLFSISSFSDSGRLN